MDQVLQGIPGVQCYLDDIIVTGVTTEKHVAALEEVLARLEAHRLRANKEKCKFFQDSVTYCGHVIAADGLLTSSKQTSAIASVPSPQDVTAEIFLGNDAVFLSVSAELSHNFITIAPTVDQRRDVVVGKRRREHFRRPRSNS